MSDPTSTLFKVSNPEEALYRDPYYDKLIDITDLLQQGHAYTLIAAGAKNVKIPPGTKRPGQAQAAGAKDTVARPIAEIDALFGVNF